MPDATADRIADADRLELLLAAEKRGRIEAQIALLQHDLADLAAKTQALVKRVTQTYFLADGDTFHPETGEITRKPPAAGGSK